jgi:hypothetical protein
MIVLVLRSRPSGLSTANLITLVCLLSQFWQSTEALTYQYFAIGSNVNPGTMLSLRNLSPLNASAAVLPGYRLVFNIPGSPLLEPSAAAAEKSNPTSNIHGALYELSEGDFTSLSRSEGVPFAYRWENCSVFSYLGDNDCAGETKAVSSGTRSIEAYVLVARRPAAPSAFIAPSPSYLKVIQEGSAYWKLDRSYQISLSRITTARKLLIPDGLSGRLLKTAEFLNPRSLDRLSTS